MNITDERVSTVVERIVNSVHPLRIILFGSKARGEARPDSDIDILVVMPDGTHRRDTMVKIYHAVGDLNVNVDVMVATSADMIDYADSPGLIYREAIREGVQLYAA
jgi:predicted nucleotidyltransferase